jgi:hypothetical protein
MNNGFSFPRRPYAAPGQNICTVLRDSQVHVSPETGTLLHKAFYSYILYIVNGWMTVLKMFDTHGILLLTGGFLYDICKHRENYTFVLSPMCRTKL